MEIESNKELCTLCTRCVRVCPATILEPRESEIRATNIESCIKCGHCVAACAHGAMIHSEFPPTKIHKINRELLPTPEQVMELIRSRRSNRAFSKRAISQEKLDLIAEAAYRAPTASNMQQVAFTLITDPAKIRLITKFTMDTFGGILKLVENPLLKPVLKLVMADVYRYVPAFKQMQDDYAAGGDKIMRGATAVLLIHSPATGRFGAEDANLAYQNASLVAQAMDVTQFYTGFVLTATRQRKGVLEKMLGIDGRIWAGMALAETAFAMENYVDRKDISLAVI